MKLRLAWKIVRRCRCVDSPYSFGQLAAAIKTIMSKRLRRLKAIRREKIELWAERVRELSRRKDAQRAWDEAVWRTLVEAEETVKAESKNLSREIIDHYARKHLEYLDRAIAYGAGVN